LHEGILEVQKVTHKLVDQRQHRLATHTTCHLKCVADTLTVWKMVVFQDVAAALTEPASACSKMESSTAALGPSASPCFIRALRSCQAASSHTTAVLTGFTMLAAACTIMLCAAC
jgi:hypothetical protein